MSAGDSGSGWPDPAAQRYEPPPPFAPPPWHEQYPQTSPYPTAELPAAGYSAPQPDTARDGRNTRRGLLASGAIVVIAAMGALAFLVFHPKGSSVAAQRHTVLRFLAAAKAGDATTASAELCAADRRADIAQRYIDTVAPRSYTVGNATRTDATHAAVAVHIEPSTGAPVDETFPVVKEKVWRVCLTQGSGVLPAASQPASNPLPSVTLPSLPHVSIPGLPGGLPSIPNAGALCASTTSASATALTYIGSVELGAAQLAQGCVYRNSVPRSVTSDLAATGAFYAPTDRSMSGPRFHFATLDGSARLTVTVAKKPDGRFYVTKVVRH